MFGYGAVLLQKDSADQEFVGRVQQFVNSSPPRSTKIAPFKILTGINMKTKYDKELVKLLEKDFLNELQEEKEKIRVDAEKNMAKI